ncbi:hypothetical protein [Pedobacter aquatilis]|uniref:hypothetical protein n=1 Tax=Pedobacter aquatilis TaxID=351343 RepID=UPI00292D07C8|nr:hypothetical protein [Pedobacter aquatilis]
MEKLLTAISLLLSWLTLPNLLQHLQPTTGLIDSGIWQLLLLALICFTSIVSGCWWLLKRFWDRLGLVGLTEMIFHFNTLQTWQKLGFYWASFALLLLTAVGCLAALL